MVTSEHKDIGALRPPLRTPPDTKRLSWPNYVPSKITTTESTAVLENAFYKAQFIWKKGLRVLSLDNKASNFSCLVSGAFSELFMIAADGRILRSSDFIVTNSSTRIDNIQCVLNLYAHDLSGTWKVNLTVIADSSPEIRLKLKISNIGNLEKKATIFWPYLSSLQIGDDPERNFYLFPFKGGWCNNLDVTLASMYGRSTGFFQMFALFNPSAGSSVYTYLKDDSGRVKMAVMKKRKREGGEVPSYIPFLEEDKPEEGSLQNIPGTQFMFRNLPVTFAVREQRLYPELVVSVSPGDWKEAFRSYANWAHSWMKRPVVPEWYKTVFQTVAVHDRSGNAGFEHGFLRNGQWALSDRAKPGDGLLEVCYWWKHLYSSGNETPSKDPWFKYAVGQYDYWDEIGGKERLKQEIEESHKKGVRVALYTTPRFAWANSDIRKAHPDWVVLKRNGSISNDWSTKINGIDIRVDDMCYSIPEWRQYMADVAGRIVRETGCDGVFMDTMNDALFCYNSAHKHPDSPSFLEEAMLKDYRKVIKTANSDAIMSAEDVCAERLLQFIDGSLIKTFEGTQPFYTDYDLYALHFVRFYFPEVKYVEWGSSYEDGARRAFFNGVGYMRGDLSAGKDPFTGRIIYSSEKLTYLTMTSRIMHENADAFSSLKPEPQVRTLVSKVYANKFPGSRQMVWTIYNRSLKDIDGNVNVIEVAHVGGATYWDLVGNKQLIPEIRGNKAVLRMHLGNGEVKAIAQRQRRLGWMPSSQYMKLK